MTLGIECTDLVLIVLGMDPTFIDPSARTLLQQFQHEALSLDPAVAHRRAVLLLDKLGVELIDEHRRPQLSLVNGGLQ